MALSKSINEGQIAISCGLCDEETKIDWKCLDCNMLMCTKCRFDHADQQHIVVNIKEIGKIPKSPDFFNIRCETHDGEICSMVCSSCGDLVCPVCILKIHKGLNFIEISDRYHTKLENLKDLLNKEERRYVELENDEERIDKFIDSEKSIYLETRKKIKDQEDELKEVITLYTDEICKNLEHNWKTNHRLLQKAKGNVTSLMKALRVEKSKTENLINYGDVSKIFKNEKKQKQRLDEIMTQENPGLPFLPKFVPGLLTRCIVGTFRPEKIEVRVEKQLTTGIYGVISLATLPDGYLWISDKRYLQKVKSEETIIFRCISTYEVWSEHLAVTPDGDLVLACNGYTLKQFNEQTVKCRDFGKSTCPFISNCVYVDDDNTIIIGGTFLPPLISEYNQVKALLFVSDKTSCEKVFAYYKNRERIFRYVKNITTSRNGNIFVVDIFPSDLFGRVVVLDSDGCVINIYDGDKKEYIEGKHFKPSALVTTANDDENTHTLHVLNNNGNLISLVNIENIGITYPTSLGFDSLGRLYIGCSGGIDDVNLFEVGISGC